MKLLLDTHILLWSLIDPNRILNLPHEDPADRFLAATCVVYGLTLVTADKRLMASPRFSVLPNE